MNGGQAVAVEAAIDHVAEACSWRDVPPQQLDDFNRRLLKTDADVLQYVYWNEPYRTLGLRPIFLMWGTEVKPTAYVCVLCVGRRPFCVGLVMRGPVSLDLGGVVPTAALRDLLCWARSNRFVFLRFTHADHQLLDRISRLGHSARTDPFPLYRDTGATYHELVVDLLPDEDATLAAFDKEARRQIRRGSEAGYTVRVEDTPEALETAWPLLLECAAQKGFRIQRPLSAYLEMVRRARPHRCVWIYTVFLGDKPVKVGLFFCSGATGWNLLAARDVAALQGHPSPAALMHWEAMRNMSRDGILYYNLGLGLGTVGSFKMQFRPRVLHYPPPVTAVLNLPLYWLWTRLVLPLLVRFEGLLRSASARLMEENEDHANG